MRQPIPLVSSFGIALRLVCPKPHKQLELHALRSLGSGKNLPHHVRPWREVKLEMRFSGTANIAKNGLLKVPPQKRVRGPAGVIE
jgi:hypothetical protein